MARAFILVLDSFGIGALPDAADFGDQGSDTLGHIAQWCTDGKADIAGVRSGPLALPNLTSLGLGEAAKLATGRYPKGLEKTTITGRYAACKEQSLGKDTPSGHWEIAGVPVRFEWGYFPPEYPSFPPELVAAFCEAAGVDGILGNCHASGTEILKTLGEEHLRTGKPICYTSADSVFQIACHEEHFGLERLYALCKIARKLVDPYNIGRVIARPFTGDAPEFVRTGNRKDYATPPPSPTLLDKLVEAGREVISVGKIADIFAHKGITTTLKATGLDALFDATLQAETIAGDGALVFSNFVDFDSSYGHRRDVAGYAAALEQFDKRLPELLARLDDGDLLLCTADHGCDPTWQGTDHTREYVPALFTGAGVGAGNGGIRESFADMGQTIATHLGIAALPEGESMF